jgi:hypothetical protein
MLQTTKHCIHVVLGTSSFTQYLAHLAKGNASFCHHLASVAVSEENNFKNQPIRNKSRLWRSCLLTDRDEMSNLYRVSVHLAEGFQRRRLKCEKLTDRQRTPSDGKNLHCLWQGELNIV